MLIAEELEQKFTKQQIFEFYANWVDLGQRGSFAISGFARGLESLFQQGSERHHSAGGGAAGGIDSAAKLFVSLPASGARDGAAQPGAGVDGGDARHHA